MDVLLMRSLVLLLVWCVSCSSRACSSELMVTAVIRDCSQGRPRDGSSAAVSCSSGRR
jgi:hypothetical protein